MPFYGQRRIQMTICTVTLIIYPHITHTLFGFDFLMGIFHRYNDFDTVQICYPLTRAIKRPLNMIYKLFSSWEAKNVLARTMISDIAIFVAMGFKEMFKTF